MKKRTTAVSEKQVSMPHLRVTRWYFSPGSETGWHRHEVPYVVVPIRGGTLTVEQQPDGSDASAYIIETGKSYFRDAGVEHNIANDSDMDIEFVEVELL